ncbi:hypothetical protein DFR30_1191 [Thiogranum longum]|uniref:DUF1415 domain-containing protein n=1 Tax=Thiogranum longum TaxID=1537524 RepID=A0A4R1H7X8_9GAMM|nr:DUF1415 domain-containing protein [Thiogranum longum]TCK17937.1 hypothetical protein DFR30_1191 [Thiogranum longum]
MIDADEEACILHTRRWVEDIIVAHGFCPFAGREVERGSIRYTVSPQSRLAAALEVLIDECLLLDADGAIETTLLIYPVGFEVFEDYLEFAALAEDLLVAQGYEGVYQLATFHPDYCFADSAEDDPANYTNRSPYPLLHLLREDSLEKAIAGHSDPEGIPERNVSYARELGLNKLRELLEKARKNQGATD